MHILRQALVLDEHVPANYAQHNTSMGVALLWTYCLFDLFEHGQIFPGNVNCSVLCQHTRICQISTDATPYSVLISTYEAGRPDNVDLSSWVST